MTKKTDLLLHPVRLRIMTELAGKQLTPRQIAEAMPDVPQASLYRHIGILVENQAMEVVGERIINGATERTYAITQGGMRLTPDDLRGLPVEEHVRLFTIYAGTLIDTFAESLKECDPDDALRDGMSYNRVTIHLSDEELVQFRAELSTIIERVWSNQPAPNRKSYTLASVVIPGKKEK